MHTVDSTGVDSAGSVQTAHKGDLASPAPNSAHHSLGRDLVTLLRPRQWAKTLLVVPLPLVGARVWSPASVGRVCLAVVVFTLASCVTYIVNDIADRERDSKHPVKRLRPIVSGRFPVFGAWLYAAVLAGLLGGLLIGLRQIPWWPVLAYLGVNASYSRGLKHVPLVDVLLIAIGFLLRLIQGYIAIGEPVSGWLMLCVLCLCLMLSLGKRRQELGTVGSSHRPSLRGYSIELLDHLILLNAVLMLTAYVHYLLTGTRLGTSAQPIALLSIPLGLFAVSRYLQLLIVRRGGGEPVATLLRDPSLIVDFALWALILATAAVGTHYPGLTHAFFATRR